MGSSYPEDFDRRTDRNATERSEQAPTNDVASDAGIEELVDRLVEMYDVLASQIVRGPCPRCRGGSSGRCPTLVMMDVIWAFVEKYRPERVAELID